VEASLSDPGCEKRHDGIDQIHQEQERADSGEYHRLVGAPELKKVLCSFSFLAVLLPSEAWQAVN
jgi:hypothetical protein